MPTSYRLHATSCILAVVIAGNSVAQDAQSESLESFHQGLTTIDTHVDIPPNLGSGDADPGKPSPMQYDLDKMERGHIDGAFFIVYVPQDELTEAGYRAAYHKASLKFDGIEKMAARYPERISLALSSKKFRRNLAEGRRSAMIGVENAFPLGANLEHLDECYSRGARYISITHVGNNQLGVSSQPGKGDPPKDTGLSPLGELLITRLNDLGVMIDVSHASKKTTLQVTKLSRAPVIASHSGAAAVFNHSRNLSDDEVRAIANTGGVIQVVAFDRYMREISEENMAGTSNILQAAGIDGPEWFSRATQGEIARLRDQVNALDKTWPRATIADLVNHIDHIATLVGVNHVGLASDFGGGGGVKGWDDAGDSAKVTEELINRGYSKDDIQKIWGDNLLRVWQEVELRATQ